MGSSRWVAVLKLYSPVLNIALHEASQDERDNSDNFRVDQINNVLLLELNSTRAYRPW